MSNETILVTGSSGTVGTAVCQRLLSEGYDVKGTDVKSNRWSDKINDRTIICDLTEKSAVEELPDSIDLIIHLAANARVHKLVNKPMFARENFDTTFNIAEYATDVGADLIFSSSREVYGNNNNKIIYDETDTYVDECESPYTASKIGGEALVRSYAKCYDIDTTILRFSNVYGKYDASNRVIPLFIAQASQGTDLTVYGDDKILDFTYIDDCVEGVVKVVEQSNKAANSTFNIASGEGTSLVEVARLIVKKTNADISIRVEENRTGEVSRYIADISKAKKILEYEPSYDIDDGIEATIDWYLSRQNLFETITS